MRGEPYRRLDPSPCEQWGYQHLVKEQPSLKSVVPSWVETVAGKTVLQKYSFELTDLTSFEKSAGEFWLEPKAARGRGRKLAAKLSKTMPQAMLAGLCIVAFDAAGDLAAVVPLATVH